eukprot:Skav223110  [mRNA]  locus=scaffold419:746351:747343:+ [translate_table: standard]
MNWGYTHFSKAAGAVPPWQTQPRGYYTVPPRRPQHGTMDLKTLLTSDIDLNQDVNALLSEEAKKELDEHLDSLINQALEKEAEDEVWVASLQEDLWKSSAQQREEEQEPASSSSGAAASSSEKTSGQAGPLTSTSEGPPPAPAEDDSSSESDHEMEMEKEHQEKEAVPPTSQGSGSGRKKVKKSVVISPAWRHGSLAALRHLRMKKLEKAKTGEFLEMQLGQIQFSQDSIKGAFRNGLKLKKTREQLITGKKDDGQNFNLNDIPRIQVVVKDGIAYSADNRRLWTFKHCGMPSNTRIPVQKGSVNDSFFKKFTTFNSGESIARRGDKSDY